VKKGNNVRKEERWKKANATRPSVVLGTRPGDEAKWQNCDLAKVLVNEEELISSTELKPTKQPVGTVYLPNQMSFGVDKAERTMLFRELPMLSAQSSGFRVGPAPDMQAVASVHAQDMEKELSKANAFAKLLDLRNASAGGIAYENRRRIITEFSESENPFDPGRSEVQGAYIDSFLSYEIADRTISCPLDIPNPQSLDPFDEFPTRYWESTWPSKTCPPTRKNSQILEGSGP
jgi:small subunit ribosomal protein S15